MLYQFIKSHFTDIFEAVAKGIQMLTSRLGIIVAFAAISIIAGCSDPKGKFEEARKQNSIEGFKHFAKEFPNDELRKQADIRIRELEWEGLSQSTDVKELQRFKTAYPGTKEASLADDRMADLFFLSLNENSDVSVIAQFLKDFPRSQRYNAARVLLEATTFSHLSPSTDKAALKQFLLDFPDSKHCTNVSELIASSILRDASIARDTKMLDEIISLYSQTQAAKDAIAARDEWVLDAAFAKLASIAEMRDFYANHLGYKGFERATVSLRNNGELVMGRNTAFFRLAVDEFPGESVNVPGPYVNEWQAGSFADAGGGMAFAKSGSAPIPVTLVSVPRGHQVRGQGSPLESLIAIECTTCKSDGRYYIIGSMR
jgi:hypothetical protein